MSQVSRYKIPALEKYVNKFIGFIFYWRLLWVLIAMGVILSLAIHTYNISSLNDKLQDFSIVITGGSIIIGIFYSIINYEHNHSKFERDTKAAKDTLSFNAACDWHRPTMVENLKITKLLYDEHKYLIGDNRAVDFFNILEQDEHARSALVSIFNYLECISLGVKHGILDGEFIEKYFRNVFGLYLRNYGFYIAHRRNVDNAPEIWINFTRLAQKWYEPKES